jgi:hypothetical protein
MAVYSGPTEPQFAVRVLPALFIAQGQRERPSSLRGSRKVVQRSFGAPGGVRTHVASFKDWRPCPLDDRGIGKLEAGTGVEPAWQSLQRMRLAIRATPPSVSIRVVNGQRRRKYKVWFSCGRKFLRCGAGRKKSEGEPSFARHGQLRAAVPTRTYWRSA